MTNAQEPLQTTNVFWAVSIDECRVVVSLVTDAYYNKINISKPPFYNNFTYRKFLSNLTFSNLNSLLPFSMDSLPSPQKISIEKLSPEEQQHYLIHQDILNIYKQFDLSPEPPWVHKINKRSPQELDNLMNTLEQASLRKF